MADRYRVTPQQSEQFVSILLMDYLINRNGNLPVLMDGNYRTLEPLVIKLSAAGYVTAPHTGHSLSYSATQKGRDALARFMQRYSEYLKVFDVFCAVDLNAGVFAFAKFYDFDTDAAWDAYLRQENWEDLRIAVAEYKKIDPLEIVFMSFINENRFDFTKSTWQFDVSSGIVWDEMEKICNSALSVAQVNQGDDTVMPDIITQGAQLSVDLLKQEEEINRRNPQPAPQQSEPQETTTITEETYYYPPQYYQPYYEPMYVSPIWLGAALFLL